MSNIAESNSGTAPVSDAQRFDEAALGSTGGYTELGYAPPRTYGGSLAFKF